VLQDAALLLRNSADVHDSHAVELDVPDEPIWFEADEGQIKQIVWNLCTNALRAMPMAGALAWVRRWTRTECSSGFVTKDWGSPPRKWKGSSSRFTAASPGGAGSGWRLFIESSRLPGVDRGGFDTGPGNDLFGAPPGAGGSDHMNVTERVPVDTAVARQQPRILVVDDEPSMRQMLAIVLKREGYDVSLAENGRSAVAALERGPFDLLISDIKMPDMSGVDVLRAAKQVDPDILGIMITAFASTETAIEAMRLGACDYLSKPFDIDLLKRRCARKVENRHLKQENVLLKRTLGLSHQFSNIIGRSETHARRLQDDRDVAKTNSTILLTGESGTGKGLVRAGDAITTRFVETSRWCRSTAARCPKPFSSRRCSGTCGAPSPAPIKTRKGFSKSPRRARSSSTRSAR
jgi:DNA-binding response OmpR family regulator